jgi:aminoglycoside phosphotransferase (APT) family kinase protein
MSTSFDSIDPGLVGWIEQTASCTVTGVEKQGRGRPAWFVDGDTAQGPKRFYVRGDRGIAQGINRHYRLSREAKLLMAVERHGIPVAHTYGYSAEHDALLQDFVPGGVFFHHIADPDERNRTGDDFMRVLARLHRLTPAALGLPQDEFHVPTTPADHALHDFALWERTHFETIESPEPFMRYAVRWLHRNVPDHVLGTVIVQGDTGPGQFIFQGGKVAAIVDWEYAHWGCPMEDLAEIRQRELLYPFGDMMARYRVYEQESGLPLDFGLIRYYTVRSLVNTPLALIGPELTRPKSHADIAERLAWNALFLRVTAEALAEASGVDISREVVTLPERIPDEPLNRLFDVVYDDLKDEHLQKIDGAYPRHRMRSTIFLFEHLRQLARVGTFLDEQELDEMSSLLGHRPASIAEGNEKLDLMVQSCGPEQDPALIRFFYRHARRKELALGDAALSQGDMGKAARLQLLQA